MQTWTQSAELVLQAEHLAKRYGSVEALRDVSLWVPRGAFCGFLGRNGAGKTTTLDVLTGLLGRERGVVRLLGEEMGLEPSVAVKQRLGYVGGHIQLYDWMTLRRHLEYVAGFYDRWDDQRCRDLLALFQLPMDQHVGSLSPGQHLQFQLVLALSRRPELLLIDEPGNLDVVVRANLMDSLLGLLREGDSTVVMASHLINELEGVCNFLCIIDYGVTVAHGPVEMLLGQGRALRLLGANEGAAALEGFWHKWVGTDELQVVMLDYSEEQAERLAREVGARTYEVGELSLEHFFMAVTRHPEGPA